MNNSLAARFASAAGASSAAMAALLLAQRFDGTMALVVVLAVVPSMAAAVLWGNPSRVAMVAPAWLLAAVAGCVRAGSAVVGEISGVHAVAGIGLLHGAIVTIIGMWCAALAATIAIAAMLPDADPAAGFVAKRMSVAGFALQLWVLAALFAGPQLRTGADVVPWLAAAGIAGVWAWFGRGAARLAAAAPVAMLLAVAGVVLIVLGGRP